MKQHNKNLSLIKKAPPNSINKANVSSSKEEVNVDSRDVIKLMLQFCMENNMAESFKAISKESGLTCNTMLPHHRKQFLTCIEKGNWTFVLETLQQPYLTFSKGLLIKLYEHVIFELVELSEENVATFLMNNIQVISNDLRLEEPARFKKLEHVVNNGKYFDNLIAYDGKNKNDIRRELSSLFQQEILSIPSSSLLNIIGNAIQYQKIQQGDDFDPNTFHLLDHTVKKIKKSQIATPLVETPSHVIVKQEEQDETSLDDSTTTNTTSELLILDRPYKIIKFGKKTKINCCHFVSDYLIVGTSDGFVEIYDFLTGKLNKELAYQANDDLIVHEDSITCVGTKVQPSGILLATASIDKTIKLWNLLTGKCLLKIQTASGANCIYFSDYDNTIISGYPNGSIKVHGLTSGGTELKDLSGHTSFINSIIQFDSEHMLSCSSDGSIRKWNTRGQNCERIYTITSMRKSVNPNDEESPSLDLPIQQILQYPSMEEFLIVCYPSNSISVLNMETGREVFKFISNKKEDVFVSITLDNNYLYGAINSNKCCIFQIPSHIPMKFEEITPLRIDDLQHNKKTIHSLSLHESILLSFSEETINLWK